MMTLDAALTCDRTFAIRNEPKPDFAGGISSLRNSWVNIPPSPFDTVSLPEVGISLQENEVIVSFKTTSEIRSAKWFNQTIEEIVRLMWLPRDWNSDNPRQIEPKSIERILAVLLTILDSDSTPPAVVPTIRGGVQVEWHQNGIDLEIEAFNLSKLEYYFSDSKGEQEGTIEDNPAVLKQFTGCLKTTSRTRRG